jgi:hypothetical protein
MESPRRLMTRAISAGINEAVSKERYQTIPRLGRTLRQESQPGPASGFPQRHVPRRLRVARSRWSCASSRCEPCSRASTGPREDPKSRRTRIGSYRVDGASQYSLFIQWSPHRPTAMAEVPARCRRCPDPPRFPPRVSLPAAPSRAAWPFSVAAFPDERALVPACSVWVWTFARRLQSAHSVTSAAPVVAGRRRHRRQAGRPRTASDAPR